MDGDVYQVTCVTAIKAQHPDGPGGIKKISYNGTTDYIDSPVTWAPK